MTRIEPLMGRNFIEYASYVIVDRAIPDIRDVLAEGDTITGKIGGLKILAAPAKGAKAVGTLAKGEEAIFTGEEKAGYLKVQSQSGEGWVQKVMVTK